MKCTKAKRVGIMNKVTFRELMNNILLKSIKRMPILIVMVILLSFLHGISWVLETIVFQRFFDSLNMAIKEGFDSNVLFKAISVALVSIYIQIINGLSNFVNVNIFDKKMQKILLEEIHNKASEIRPLQYEVRKNLELIEYAKGTVINVISIIRMTISILTFNLPYQIFMAYYLYKKLPILLLVFPFIFIPLLVNQIISINTRSININDYMTKEREYKYYKNNIVGSKDFKETRILNVKDFFLKKYKHSFIEYKELFIKTEKKVLIREVIMQFITMLGFTATIILLINNLLKNRITIGVFMAVFTSMDSIYRFMDNLITRDIGNIFKNIGHIKKLIDYFNIEKVENASKPMEGIKENEIVVLNSVSFKYPDTTHHTIKNLNLRLKNKETIAIVGANGSGKTTLVKLILGLYEPQEGSIYRRIDKDYTSAVFQDFEKYKLTLKDNIVISDSIKEIDYNRLNKVIKMTGVNLDIFPNGAETQMGREFDGIELSGGQWQRVAIARGIYRVGDFVILDEPTSAIDPINENSILNLFVDISQNRNAIIITHRVGAAKIADRIIVMDNGRIVEDGKHQELLNKKGTYHYIYNSQAQWYQ